MKVFLVLFIIGAVFIIDSRCLRKKGDPKPCLPKDTKWSGKLTKKAYQCGARDDPHFHQYADQDHIGSFKIGKSAYKIPKAEDKRKARCDDFKCDLVDRLKDDADTQVRPCLTCMEQMASQLICKDFWAQSRCWNWSKNLTGRVTESVQAFFRVQNPVAATCAK